MKKILLIISLIISLILISYKYSPVKPISAQTSPLSNIHHVWVIIEENQDWSAITNPSSSHYMPTLITSFLPQGAHANNYHNVPTSLGSLHPSEPNYMWFEGGTNIYPDHTFGGDADSSSSNDTTSTAHISTLLTNKGISWKSYQEGMPSGACPIKSGGSSYAAKHNPMIFFTDVVGNPPSASHYAGTECAKVVPYTQLATDLNNINTTPSYNFITPNLCNDMHDCGGSTADTWLWNGSGTGAVQLIMNSAAYKQDGAIFITWDEGGSGNNPIGMVMLSPFAKVNYSNSIAYSHASYAKTVENIFGLSPFVGHAADASTTDLSDFFTTTIQPTPTTGGPTPTRTPTPIPPTNTPTSIPPTPTRTPTPLPTGQPTLTPTPTPSSCLTLPSNTGSDTMSFDINSNGNYIVWSRILGLGDSSNSFYLQVDSTCPFMVGDLNGMPSGQWTWVNYQNGSSSSTISLNLTAGTHTLKLVGKEPTVGVDRVVFTTNSGCVPTGNGDNCLPQPTNTPTPTPTSTGNTWYVSKNGNNGTGNSWATAWNELNTIKWASVAAGDTIMIDGGSTSCASPFYANNSSPYDFPTKPGQSGNNCGMLYTTALSVGKSGTVSAPIKIQLSTESGHNGAAILFGGRTASLPYCDQTTYTNQTSGVLPTGITLGNNSFVTIDGIKRSGIVIYGFTQGITTSSSTANMTLRNIESFDNGVATHGNTSSSFGSPAQGSPSGWWSDGWSVEMNGGSNLTFDRDLFHDEGQDIFHGGNNISNYIITNSWLYYSRNNPNLLGNPFNMAANGQCTHVDGFQLFAPGPNSGLTIQNTIIGPYINQGLYPTDTNQKYNNVTLNNVLFIHNIGSMINTVTAQNTGWSMSNLTLYRFGAAPDGNTCCTIDGSNWQSGDTITNSISYGADINNPGLGGSNNIYFNSFGATLAGGTSTNPNFTSPLTTGTPTFAQLQAVDLTPNCGSCSGKGSSLHKFQDILNLIDSLNGSPLTPTPTIAPPTPTRTPTQVPPTPTNSPTVTPTLVPPTSTPTRTPTPIPPTPTNTPTVTPTPIPPTPTRTPTPSPTNTPTPIPPTPTNTPTATPTPVPTGDFNHDESINLIDLSILLSNFNSTNLSYDLNGDGVVNSIDYSQLINILKNNGTIQ